MMKKKSFRISLIVSPLLLFCGVLFSNCPGLGPVRGQNMFE